MFFFVHTILYRPWWQWSLLNKWYWHTRCNKPHKNNPWYMYIWQANCWDEKAKDTFWLKSKQVPQETDWEWSRLSPMWTSSCWDWGAEGIQCLTHWAPQSVPDASSKCHKSIWGPQTRKSFQSTSRESSSKTLFLYIFFGGHSAWPLPAKFRVLAYSRDRLIVK